MISNEDWQWLSGRFPGLELVDNAISGTVEFIATYNQALNRFLVLGADVVDDVNGIQLSSSYHIRISKRDTATYSDLPALHVDGVDLSAERHFGRLDKSACLCSPIEEADFLRPAFDFKKFFEQLVLPFLYAQTYFSAYGHWPWKEYAHGATGLLESFSDEDVTDEDEVRRFLTKVALDEVAWPQIRALLQRDIVKGHTRCFCVKHDLIRRCHPRALAGLRLLHRRVNQKSLDLPPVRS